MQNILTFEQLTADTPMTREELLSVAHLIYGTDPYIYPAMCSAEEAEKILPRLLTDGVDAMFCKQNLFVARLQDRIISLILWHEGPLIWNKNAYLNTCKSENIPVSPTFDQVAREYLGAYDRPAAEVSIINVCVVPDLRGKGVAAANLQAFISGRKEKSMELVTLKDNAAAVALYERNGFCVVREENGFAVGDVKPRCLVMRRPAGK